MRTVFRIMRVMLFLCTIPAALTARGDEPLDVSEALGRTIDATKLKYRDNEHFVIAQVRMSTGYVQEVFISKQAQVLGEVPFVEITAIGWKWEDATEFSRQNANWLLDASTEMKVGAWQSLKFDDEDAVAAEFRATIPLDSLPRTFEVVIKGVASSAFELHDLMDK